jgi:hypothetical protein
MKSFIKFSFIFFVLFIICTKCEEPEIEYKEIHETISKIGNLQSGGKGEK